MSHIDFLSRTKKKKGALMLLGPEWLLTVAFTRSLQTLTPVSASGSSFFCEEKPRRASAVLVSSQLCLLWVIIGTPKDIKTGRESTALKYQQCSSVSLIKCWHDHPTSKTFIMLKLNPLTRMLDSLSVPPSAMKRTEMQTSQHTCGTPGTILQQGTKVTAIPN